MQKWLVTIPKTVPWRSYIREVKDAEEKGLILNYRTQANKNIKSGDQLYVIWNGKVRGWMKIVGTLRRMSYWNCETTGRVWPPGFYIQRIGEFHHIKDGQKIRGFQGIRKYEE